MRRLSVPGFFSPDRRSSFCGIGLVLGTLFFAASLTPSLVPRSPMVQGVLGGFCLGAGYGLGVLLRRVWRALALPALSPQARQLVLLLVLAAWVAAAIVRLPGNRSKPTVTRVRQPGRRAAQRPWPCVCLRSLPGCLGQPDLAVRLNA